MSSQASLTYFGFIVEKMTFDRGNLDVNDDEAEFRVNVNYACNANIDDDMDFNITFIIAITHTKYVDFNLQVEAAGMFKILGNPAPEVYSNLTEISAPSIVYPYLRAFISTLVNQAGMKPLFIPAQNFGNHRRTILRPKEIIDEKPKKKQKHK